MDNRIRAIQRYSAPTITDLARAGLIQLAPPIQRNVTNLKLTIQAAVEMAVSRGSWGKNFNRATAVWSLQCHWWCNQPALGFDGGGYPYDYHYLDPHNWDLDGTQQVYNIPNAAEESVMPSGWEAWGIPFGPPRRDRSAPRRAQ